MNDENRCGNQGLTVLVAEDEEDDAILIRRAVDRLPMVDRLILVENGDEAIEYLWGIGKYADRRIYPFPGVLVLDHVMPRLSGLEVICWLRSEPRFAWLPVVIFSGHFLPRQTEMAARLNAVCVLKTSSFTEMPQAIEQGIRSALGTASPRSELQQLEREHQIFHALTSGQSPAPPRIR